MTALPQTKSFPWKWNDCMTDCTNHEYVNNSWTRPCLAISLWGILFRNQMTLYQNLLGDFVITIHVWSTSLGELKKKKKKIHKGRRNVADSGNQSYVHTLSIGRIRRLKIQQKFLGGSKNLFCRLLIKVSFYCSHP